MALRATEEPRLISAMATPERKEAQTALRGMFHPGETWVVRGQGKQGGSDDVSTMGMVDREMGGQDKEKKSSGEGTKREWE